MTQVSLNVDSAPPATPRPITPVSVRRSWWEAGVRAWWLMAAGLLLAGVLLSASELAASLRDRNLVRKGQRVEAKIVAAGDTTLEGKIWQPENNVVFTMEYELGGQKRTIIDHLKDQRVPLGPGMHVTLYVNPEDPNQWTDRTDVSLLKDMAVGLFLLPLVAIFVGVAELKRRRVLRRWRDGEAAVASVVQVTHSPLAPSSSLLRMTLRDGRNKRILTALLPHSVGRLKAGDELWVVPMSERSRAALVAGLYQ